MSRHAEFAHDEHVQWGAKRLGDLECHGNATTRQAEYLNPARPRQILQASGQLAARIVAI
jgi:hypothetical protein